MAAGLARANCTIIRTTQIPAAIAVRAAVARVANLTRRPRCMFEESGAESAFTAAQPAKAKAAPSTHLEFTTLSGPRDSPQKTKNINILKTTKHKTLTKHPQRKKHPKL